MLNVRNVLNDAERAKDKKAPIGVDVTIENFSDEIIDGIDLSLLLSGEKLHNRGLDNGNQ